MSDARVRRTRNKQITDFSSDWFVISDYVFTGP